MTATTNVRMLTRYKAWANEIVFSMVAALPTEEALMPRKSAFKNMVHTLNHAYVIDAVFQAHLQGREHGYTARNTADTPPLEELRQSVRAMDAWYIDYADTMSAEDLDRMIRFEFIGGGDGAMTCNEIILHIVNHGTYHRGFVGDMLYQAGVRPVATDLPVFLRDVPREF
jgi:uncharacterized damage-inducible protein DinB